MKGAAPTKSVQRKNTVRKSKSSEVDANFTVYIRVRPKTQREIDKENVKGKQFKLLRMREHDIGILHPGYSKSQFFNKEKRFPVDGIFSGEDDTKKVYSKTVLPILGNLLEGYNATVFAYGMTGVGKTYTMFGNMNSLGEVDSR